MVLKKFIFYKDKKKQVIYGEICDTIWKKFRGIMFREKSPSLIFTFNKEKTISIHSFFCKRFRAIWLDKNKKVIKERVIPPNRPNFSFKGKYLIETILE